MAILDKFRVNGTDYDLRDSKAVRFDEQTLTNAQKQAARQNIGAADDSNSVHVNDAQSLTDQQKAAARGNISAASLDDIAAIGVDARLLNSIIKGTRQVVVYTGGVVTGVNHIDGSNHTVRADIFAVESDPMVETRTLDTGERLTISTDLTTLTSTITYTPASA